ncbi:MAG: hypothetical protein AAF202_13130, partial [Pseudomonadota bacterium]
MSYSGSSGLQRYVPALLGTTPSQQCSLIHRFPSRHQVFLSIAEELTGKYQLQYLCLGAHNALVVVLVGSHRRHDALRSTGAAALHLPVECAGPWTGNPASASREAA